VTAPGVDISPAVGGDLGSLFASARSAFAGFPGWSDRRVLDGLSRSTVFVARERGAPAGYVALTRAADDTVRIEQLLVAPGHERCGIGRGLLGYAEGYAISTRARTLQVVVEERNATARSLYRRCGFVPVAPELFELVLPRIG
jgi:ribosomal protein S18 acetylase RimI-like enzyme